MSFFLLSVYSLFLSHSFQLTLSFASNLLGACPQKAFLQVKTFHMFWEKLFISVGESSWIPVAFSHVLKAKLPMYTAIFTVATFVFFLGSKKFCLHSVRLPSYVRKPLALDLWVQSPAFLIVFVRACGSDALFLQFMSFICEEYLNSLSGESCLENHTVQT